MSRTWADNAAGGPAIPDRGQQEVGGGGESRPGRPAQRVVGPGDSNQLHLGGELLGAPERVPLALDHQGRDRRAEQFGEAAAVRPAGRVQREGEAGHGPRPERPGGAAGHPRAEAAPAGHHREPGEPVGDLTDGTGEGDVESAGRGRRAAAGHPVGLFDPGDHEAAGGELAGQPGEVGRGYAAAGAVAQRGQAARPAGGQSQVRPSRPGVGRDFDHFVAGGRPSAHPGCRHACQGKERGVSTEPSLTEDDDGYRRFYSAVAARQLADWLRAPAADVLDLSGDGVAEAVLAAAGHRRVPPPDLLREVAPGSVDMVVAEPLAQELALTAEVTFGEVARALRPGGRFFLSVGSLVLGLGQLAGQGRWAELTDSPEADVLLVPEDGGNVHRCFWPGELREGLEEAGLVVEWIRPRTVLSPPAVSRILTEHGGRLGQLVATELALAGERDGEAVGRYLVASAVKPG